MKERRNQVAAGLAALTLAVGLAPQAATAHDDGADGRFSQRRSSHFVLRQDVDIDRYSGPAGSRRFELDVLEILEAAHDRVADALRLRPPQPIEVLVYDARIFDGQYAPMFRFRAAGFYNGIIHVRGGTTVDARLARTLHHEYVHAALGAAAPEGTFPGWLNEGLAEYFERLALGQRRLTPGEDAFLRRAARQGAWIPLAQLNGSGFGRLDSDDAALAYLESYATIEFLARGHGVRKLRRLCDQLIRTRILERALKRTYGSSLVEIEAALLHELR